MFAAEKKPIGGHVMASVFTTSPLLRASIDATLLLDRLTLPPLVFISAREGPRRGLPK